MKIQETSWRRKDYQHFTWCWRWSSCKRSRLLKTCGKSQRANDKSFQKAWKGQNKIPSSHWPI